jgi:hypothetical protein
VPPSPLRPRPAKRIAVRPADSAATVRNLNPADVVRLAHNRACVERAAAMAAVRDATLGSHAAILAPFVTRPVLEHLTAAAKGAGGPPSPATTYPLPKAITATLREHQVVGFQWLAKAFHSGLHPILGWVVWTALCPLSTPHVACCCVMCHTCGRGGGRGGPHALGACVG